jgi:hypothetical protein
MQLGQRAEQHALIGIAPLDPVKGKLAAQVMARHDAIMDCVRRAHAAEPTVRRQDPEREPMPLARGAREAAV